jgi:hypothetical protein
MQIIDPIPIQIQIGRLRVQGKSDPRSSEIANRFRAMPAKRRRYDHAEREAFD